MSIWHRSDTHALYTLVEADGKLPFAGKYKEHGFVTGPEHVQPGRTVKIPLLDDDALLKQMRQNTRYSVRLAMRRGVRSCAAAGTMASRTSIDC